MKECITCSRYLSDGYKDSICPVCKELALFDNVKEYIRNNNVNVCQVAKHFQISVRQVRKWIKEGRIDYKVTSKDEGQLLYLIDCGCSMKAAGTILCPKCELKRKQIRTFTNSSIINEYEKMKFSHENYS